MQKIFQLENGQILISNGTNEYTDTLTNFSKDYPVLPAITSTLIIYNPTLKTYILDGKMQPYTAQSNFDTCINAIKDILSAQAKRNS